MPSSSSSAGLSSRARDLFVVVGERHAAPPYAWNGAEHILTPTTTRRRTRWPFELPPLPYDYDALEPTIDAKTMEIHHGKHHQAYVDNLNTALEGTEWADRVDRGRDPEPRRDPRGQARGRAQQRRRALRTTRSSGRSCSRAAAAIRPATLEAAINDAFGDPDAAQGGRSTTRA